ncbi:hypothetical protein IMZ48_26665 [Candidatus Bathyarchaeota archaeon]|nr:hypothetical protein [Candidatus Bathyarchaeota archaeon]
MPSSVGASPLPLSTKNARFNPHPVFLPQSVAAAKGPEIEALGEEVISDQIFNWVTDSERNTPYVKGNGRDPFGQFKGELVVGEGWRKLQEFGIKKGCVPTSC